MSQPVFGVCACVIPAAVWACASEARPRAPGIPLVVISETLVHLLLPQPEMGWLIPFLTEKLETTQSSLVFTMQFGPFFAVLWIETRSGAR